MRAYQALNNETNVWGHLPFPNSVLLYGPKSSGKTYLTKIWQNKTKALLVKNNQSLDEQMLSTNSDFIIEDIETWDMELLLHYFNLINENKKRLLVTTGQAINNFDLKDLESRIKSIVRLEITPLDDELLKIFLFKLFSDSSVIVTHSVQEYLINRLPKEFVEIRRIVAQINEFALVNKRNLTIPLVKEAMLSMNLG
jgi:chromosomal replication initiation ATPase DnaA